MSVHLMNLENADCTTLYLGLVELAKNWTKELALAHNTIEGELYEKIRKKIQSQCGEDYVIRDIKSSGEYSVVENA